MKLSTQTIMNQPVKAMLEQQEALYKTQQQLASGKNILQPSDDPSGTARANQLRDAMGRTDQYIVNGETAEARLTQEESIFSSIVNSMQRVRELAIQSLNDTLTESDRRMIGLEIEQAFQEVMGLANSKAASGEYLFGGYQGDTEPFTNTYSINSVLASQNNIGNATATASAGTNGVIADELRFSGDINSVVTIADNEEASSIAININAVPGLTATASNTVTMTIPNSALASATDYSFSIGNPAPLGAVGPVDLTAVGLGGLATAIMTANADLQADVVGSDIIITNTTNPGNDITIQDVSYDAAVNIDSIMTVNGIVLDEAGAKTSNDSITVGGTVSIVDPTSSFEYKITSIHSKNVMRSNLTQSKELVLDYNGDSGQRDIKIGDGVTIQMNDTGDELFVNLPSAADSDQNKSIFNMLYDFMSELKAGVRPSDDILTDIDTAMGQVETTRAAVGSRLNIIDRQRMINVDYSIFSQQNISRIEDLDMAEAISMLNQQLLSMQVLQQTFTRVSGLSMFNYL